MPLSSETKDLQNATCYFPASHSAFREIKMGVKHAVLSGGLPPTVAFTAFAQLCGPKVKEKETGIAFFTKNCEDI